MKNDFNVYKTCPMCNKDCYIAVNGKDYTKYTWGGLIQDCFPYLDSFEREFIKTGYCPDCQELLFNNKYKGNKIKEEK